MSVKEKQILILPLKATLFFPCKFLWEGR